MKVGKSSIVTLLLVLAAACFVMAQLHRVPRALDIQRAAEFKNVPINCWGKVVDENDQPLSNVSVEMALRRVQGVRFHSSSVFETARRTSDASGLFAITGARGDMLSVKSLRK